jgi:hypothetical protein
MGSLSFFAANNVIGLCIQALDDASSFDVVLCGEDG